MRRIFALSTVFLFTLAVAACNGEPDVDVDPDVEPEPEVAELEMPDWMEVDHEAETVTMEVIAGKTGALNRWNFNGYHSGNATIVVPEGYEITMEWRNEDRANPHSVGVDEQVGDYPSTYDEVTPAFEGALSSNPTSMQRSTQYGESETLVFTADRAGEYALVCYVPAHAVTGMWIHFHVSAEGEAGLRTS